MSESKIDPQSRKRAMACADAAGLAFRKSFNREPRDLGDATWMAGYAASLHDRASHEPCALRRELVAARVILEQIEAHCANTRGLTGIDHADDGRKLRAGLQAFLAAPSSATTPPQSEQQFIGFVAHHNGHAVRDFALPGEQHQLAEGYEWAPVYRVRQRTGPCTCFYMGPKHDQRPGHDADCPAANRRADKA